MRARASAAGEQTRLEAIATSTITSPRSSTTFTLQAAISSFGSWIRNPASHDASLGVGRDVVGAGGDVARAGQRPAAQQRAADEGAGREDAGAHHQNAVV